MPRLFIWREDNLWSTEPDWRFGSPVQQVIAREFYGPTGGRGQIRRVGPRLLKNSAVLAVLAAVPMATVPCRDRASLQAVLAYLAGGGDLHAEWDP
jgi:hypothetical protein